MGAKRMKSLLRYELDFDLTLNYVQDNLSSAKTLSEQLIKLVDFKEGCFFALIRPEIDKKRIHEFSYSLSMSSIQDELIDFIYNKLNKNQKLTALFEDILLTTKSAYLELFEECGLQYNDEIIYSVNKNNVSHSLISRCLFNCNAIWHSLCILTNINTEKKESKILTLDMINNACLSIQLVIIGAYDGEGYIFWEKSD